MSDKENVLLFGLGGIGGIYASILSLSGAVNVHVVARSNYENVKEKGFKLVSQKFGDHDITFDGGESTFLVPHNSRRRLVINTCYLIRDCECGVPFTTTLLRYNYKVNIADD